MIYYLLASLAIILAIFEIYPQKPWFCHLTGEFRSCFWSTHFVIHLAEYICLRSLDLDEKFLYFFFRSLEEPLRIFLQTALHLFIVVTNFLVNVGGNKYETTRCKTYYASAQNDPAPNATIVQRWLWILLKSLFRLFIFLTTPPCLP